MITAVKDKIRCMYVTRGFLPFYPRPLIQPFICETGYLLVIRTARIPCENSRRWKNEVKCSSPAFNLNSSIIL